MIRTVRCAVCDVEVLVGRNRAAWYVLREQLGSVCGACGDTRVEERRYDFCGWPCLATWVKGLPAEEQA